MLFKGFLIYSILSDYIGRPIQAYSEEGELVWRADYDIYGKLRNLVGNRMFIPFRQLEQYEDIELDGLYYNRFRYYDSKVLLTFELDAKITNQGFEAREIRYKVDRAAGEVRMVKMNNWNQKYN